MEEDKKSFKEKFKLLWANKRLRSVMTLGIYFLFIALVLVIVSVGSKMSSDTPLEEPLTEEKEETVKKTYEDMVQELSNNNYRYEYNIIINDEKIVFEGIKLNNKETGTKETSLGIIKYYIDETGTYQTNLDQKVLIDNLYLNLDSSYFDLKSLFVTILDYQSIDSVLNDYQTKTYQVGSLEDITTIVVFYKDTISEIKISNNNFNYHIKISDIGEITENNFN